MYVSYTHTHTHTLIHTYTHTQREWERDLLCDWLIRSRRPEVPQLAVCKLPNNTRRWWDSSLVPRPRTWSPEGRGKEDMDVPTQARDWSTPLPPLPFSSDQPLSWGPRWDPWLVKLASLTPSTHSNGDLFHNHPHRHSQKLYFTN